MKNSMDDQKHLLVYQSDDGRLKIDIPFDGDTIWLTQEQIGSLFHTTVQNVGQHIKNIYEENELESQQTLKKIFKLVENNRRYPVQHYSLDMIISVGYRINSAVATRFRQWATQTLKEYMVKGFAMDDKRLAEGGNSFAGRGYFDELLERVRTIRTSERLFYEKVKEVFSATSYDYASGSDEAKAFYATVQNKFHFAVTGHTAAEIIAKRIDSSKPRAGLTVVKGEQPTVAEARVAKNYMLEDELRRLYLISEQFLSFAELKVQTKKTMTMAEWRTKLDDMLALNDLAVLRDKGSMSHDQMEKKVRAELKKYAAKQKDLQASNPAKSQLQ